MEKNTLTRDEVCGILAEACMCHIIDKAQAKKIIRLAVMRLGGTSLIEEIRRINEERHGE